MVAKITTGKNIVGLINYNENKVEKGQARLIGGENMSFGKLIDELTYGEKVGVFKEVIAGKQNTQHVKTAFHVSLSLDPAEKPTDETLKSIADVYMQKMGYSDQPYLVYRHEDTKHPHLHIVSTSVDSEGRKIDDSFSKYKSEQIRKSLEVEFGLVVASEKKKQSREEKISPLTPVAYGKEETKEAISRVIRGVLEEYKVSRFKEFAAVLATYHVKAEHIKIQTKEGEKQGVVFSATDEKGKRVGKPMKASGFSFKPTLERLEARFEKNLETKKRIAMQTAAAIDKVLALHSSITRGDFTSKLAARGIQALFHEGKSGVFGVSFVNTNSKAIFKGSELGKDYSWNNLSKRFGDVTVSADVELPTLRASELLRFAESAPGSASIGSDKQGIGLLDREIKEKATSALATIYDKLRRDPQQGAFFESGFIRKLDKVDLVSPLLVARKELTPLQATELSAGFEAYKTKGLAEVENKEREYFKKGMEGAMRFLYQAPESFAASERIAFLYRNNFKVGKGDGQYFITHIHGDHLRQNVDADRYQRFVGGAAAEVDTSKLTGYSKGEKAFIAAVADGKITGSELDIFSIRYAHFKPMLSEANAKLVERELTATYYKKLSGELGKTCGGSKLAEELAKRGLQVLPVMEKGRAKGYLVRYVGFPEGKIPVSALVAGQLLSEGYSRLPAADTVKYRLLVDLHQSRDRKDASGIERTLQKVEKVNPGFAATLKKEIEPLRQRIAKGDSGSKERLTGSMLNTLIERISRYGGDSMREMKLTGSAEKADLSGIRMDTGSKEYEEKGKTKTTFADAFGGTNESGGPEQDPKKNKGKKIKP